MPRVRKYQTNAQRQAAYRQRRAGQGDTNLAAHQSTPIPSVPGRRRWKALAKQAYALLHCAVNEMQDYFDGHSEAWQDSQQGEALAEMLESLEDALASLENVATPTRHTKHLIT